MERLGEQLSDLIRERYHGMPRLAKELGVSRQTLYSMCRNDVIGSSFDIVVRVANALGIDPIALHAGKIEQQVRTTVNYHCVPIYAKPHGGHEVADAGEAASYPVPQRLHVLYPSAFFVPVRDSSTNRILPEGCLALVDPCSEIRSPGKPYALTIEDGPFVVKRVKPLANGLELQPDSTDSTYRAQVIDFNEPGNRRVSIAGEVVWYAIPFEWEFRSG
jgi:repressor LexA